MLENKDKKNIFKKAITIALLFAIVFTSLFFYSPQIKTAEALIEVPTGNLKDDLDNAQNWVQTIKDWAKELEDLYLNKVAAAFRKKLLDYVVDEIITWIAGGGEPKFVSDWQGFLIDVADQAGGDFINKEWPELANNLCQADWALKIQLSLQSPPKFGTRIQCTPSLIGENFNNFISDFNEGGWTNWIAVSEAQNNPYALYLTILDKKFEKEYLAREAAEKEATAGSGFTDDKNCVKVSYTDASGNRATITGSYDSKDFTDLKNLLDDVKCDQFKTKTPGDTIAEGLKKTAFKDIDWLVKNESFWSYVAAIGDAVINRITKEGVLAIKGMGEESGSEGSPNIESTTLPPSDFFDNTAPITTTSFFDAWRVEIKSNEPGFIYFTIDGTNPNITSPTYSSPIPVSTSTTLTWFGTDNAGNNEGIQSLLLNPPFNVSQTAPSTVAVAVDVNRIALLADKPATIYYTTDGSTPNTNSERYIKTINVDDPFARLQIIWFGVGSGGEEPIKNSLTEMPPFPNNELPQIRDLIKPTATITGPNSANSNQFFSLDPSSSWDFDNTPLIAQYEWDFDSDGQYDWTMTDWNRDGVLESFQCRTGATCVSPITGIGNGFDGVRMPSDGQHGEIEVKYTSGFGSKTIGLRVTDDEGLSEIISINVNVN